MTAVRQDFDIYDADAKNIVFNVTQSGAVYDLTNAAVTWAVAKMPNATALFSKSEGSGIVVTDAANGQVTVTIDANDFTAPGLYYHALKVVDGTDTQIVSAGRVTAFGTPA